MSIIRIPKIHNGHWKFGSKQMGNGIGFIYVIRDPYSGFLYLGKKQYKGTRGAALGKESNWKTYISSSNALKEIMSERHKEDFEFICLEEYKTKGGLRYAEAWSLFYVNALMKEEWLNGRIDKITWKVTEGPSFNHIMRLNDAMLWKEIK